MSPLQTSKYKKTKEGYIIDIEDHLNMILPLIYWRLKIEKAFLLWESLKKNENYFFYICGALGLPFVSQLKEESKNENKI